MPFQIFMPGVEFPDDNSGAIVSGKRGMAVPYGSVYAGKLKSISYALYTVIPRLTEPLSVHPTVSRGVSGICQFAG